MGMSRINQWFMAVLFVAAFYFGYRIVEPFLIIVILAIIMVSVTHPIYRKLEKWLKGKKALASLFTCLLVTAGILLPLFLMTLVLAGQSLSAYQFISEKLSSGALEQYNLETLKAFITKYAPFLEIESLNLNEELSGLFKNISSWLVQSTASMLSNIGIFISNFFLMIFTLFFLYKDGDKFLALLTHLSPLPLSVEQRIFEKFKAVSKSIFMGVFLTALLQGVVGGIAFLIAGISPFFWGGLLALSSIVPLVGTALVWLPVGIVLFLTGSTGMALFLMIWCLIFGLLIDNGIKPLLIKGKTDMHPLVIFFSILGGIQFWGILGIILGPLAISFLLLLLDIYEQYYRPLLSKMDKS